jgi:hypothetical protein
MPKQARIIELCAGCGLQGNYPRIAPNEHLFVSKSRVSADTVPGVCLQLDGCHVPGAPPSFPAAGIIGSRADIACRATSSCDRLPRNGGAWAGKSGVRRARLARCRPLGGLAGRGARGADRGLAADRQGALGDRLGHAGRGTRRGAVLRLDRRSAQGLRRVVPAAVLAPPARELMVDGQRGQGQGAGRRHTNRSAPPRSRPISPSSGSASPAGTP